MVSTVNRVKFILPIISFFCALYGLYHYLKNGEENACDMTYMFEYPEYLKIPLNYTSIVRFPRYNLYVYAEGKYAEDLSAQKFHGLPVLFIPGNGGSHRQVRSLASVALRMSQSRQTTLHFNFFSIDFNEEISALYGGTLIDQTEFVLECIQRIGALYPVKKKLILIGHSMGGVIAKATFSLPNFDPTSVSLILTLASPHRKPVITIDSDISLLYEKTRRAWKYRLKEELRHIPIVSIGGGSRDVVVRSDLISNHFEHASHLDINTLTCAIPDVWISTDHLAIVWCKQLVLTVCRSLFDFSSPESTPENVLKFHYVSKSSRKHLPSSWSIPFQVFPSSAHWIKQQGNAWRYSRAKVLSSIYIFIPIWKDDNVIVIASGLMKGDWIFGCTQLSNTANETCSEGENLSHRGQIIPSRKTNVERRMVHFKTQDLQRKGYLSLIVYIAPVDSQVEILGETYLESDRVKHYSLPSMFERIFSLAPHRVFTISLVEQIVYYNVTLSRSAGVFQAVEFQLETRLCRAGSVVGQGLVRMHVPWSSEDSYYHVRTSLGGLTHIPAIVHSQPPAHVSPDINLLFILDPECSVVLMARFPFYLMASQFVKFYGTYVLAYSIAFLLVLLSDQMSFMGSQGTPPSVHEIFGKVLSFFILAVLPSICYHLLWIFEISSSFIPKPDVLDESYELYASLLVRTLLYLIAGGFILLLYLATECLLRIISAVWMYFMSKTILKTTQMPLEKLSKDRVRISKWTLVWSSVFAALCVGVSTSLASAMILIYYFFKLSRMHIRCRLEEDRRGSSAATRTWHFHMLLMLLWFFVVLLTCPGLVMWTKNLRFTLKTNGDVYLLPCTAMVICMAVLWQLPTPIWHRSKYGALALLLRNIAVVVTLFGISSMYRLLYFLATAFVCICLQQLYAYFQGFSYIKYD